MCQVVVPNDHGKGHTREQNVQYLDQSVLPNDFIQFDLFDGYFQTPPVLNNNANDFGNYGGYLQQYEAPQGYNNNMNVVMGVPNTVSNVYPVQQAQELVASHQEDGANTASAKPGRPPLGKRKGKKSPEEIAAQIERVKQRRRESAQRSRNRKCEYMKSLEEENKKLRDENQYLRQMLSQKYSMESGKEGTTGMGADTGSVISRVDGEHFVKPERISSSTSLSPSLQGLMEMNETLPVLSDILDIPV